VPGSAWAAAALFGAVGLFAISVGLLDVLSATNLQYKLIGFAFAVAGLALFTGSTVLLRRRWRATHGRIASIVAGLFGAFVGVYLLMLQYGAPALAPSRLPPFPSWVPWAALVVASGAGAVLGWWSTGEYADYQVTWTAVSKRLVAGGLSVTVLFAGVNWWYTQQYQPNTIAAALTVTTELKPATGEGQTPNPHLFQGTIKVKNVADTKVEIVNSSYQVTKVTNTPRAAVEGVNPVYEDRQALACFAEELAPVTDPECDDQARILQYGQLSPGDPRELSTPLISRTGQFDTAELLQLGEIVPAGSWLEPKEEFQTNVLVHVPEEQVDPTQPAQPAPDLRMLDLSAQLAVAQGSRLVIQPVPSHGPEMVPQALMSNEEYRDDNEAEAQQREAQQAGGQCGQPGGGTPSHAASQPVSTAEVDFARRQAYYQHLTMPPLQDVQCPQGTPQPAKKPRPYPDRYTVTEWRIKDLSKLQRLVSGSQAVDAVQVLSRRLFDPAQSALYEVELPEMVTCISPAGTLEAQKEDLEIRRDPTAVCPGQFYSLAEHDGSLQGDYERRYQAMADYRQEMADFYGLISTSAESVVPLTAETDAASETMPDSSQVHTVTSNVFNYCAPRLQFADAVTDVWIKVQQAFDRHASGMGMSTGREIVDDALSLADGATTADYVDPYGEQAQDRLHPCGSDGESVTNVVKGSGADYCIQAADAKVTALQHARDLGEAVRQHQEIMKQYEDKVITVRQRDAMGAPSLEQGASAADAFLQAEYNADQLVAYCR